MLTSTTPLKFMKRRKCFSHPYGRYSLQLAYYFMGIQYTRFSHPFGRYLLQQLRDEGGRSQQCFSHTSYAKASVGKAPMVDTHFNAQHTWYCSKIKCFSHPYGRYSSQIIVWDKLSTNSNSVSALPAEVNT